MHEWWVLACNGQIRNRYIRQIYSKKNKIEWISCVILYDLKSCVHLFNIYVLLLLLLHFFFLSLFRLFLNINLWLFVRRLLSSIYHVILGQAVWIFCRGVEIETKTPSFQKQKKSYKCCVWYFNIHCSIISSTYTVSLQLLVSQATI